jgi:phosphopantothenate-cysteine ligase/phosphopantothenoylcysteine decarboxylase/phosphopantothenate--cysteine ligase
MKLLVVAGNTMSPIDRVRGITNIFTGRTGASIAAVAKSRGHDATLLTSHPETSPNEVAAIAYRTYDELHSLLQQEIMIGGYDAIVMSAAVNDYQCVGTYAPADGTTFDDNGLSLTGPLVDVARGKVKGNHRELWLRLVPAPKLIDRIRTPWGFRGALVKFKLEVDVTDDKLLAIGDASRRQSRADWLVANTLEGRDAVAWILGENRPPAKIERPRLAAELLDRLEGRIP